MPKLYHSSLLPMFPLHSTFSFRLFQPSCLLTAAVAASSRPEALRLTAGAAAGEARRSCLSLGTERPPPLSPVAQLGG